MRLISPMQVDRYDGSNVFMELMIDAIAINKVSINFSQYDAKRAEGNRTIHSVSIFLDIAKANILAEQILNGDLHTSAEQERAKAAAAGSKYPKEVYSANGGSTQAGREDGKAESRVFKIVPGNAKPWILTAEKGPGHLSPTGLIVPDYRSGQGDCIIRVPMTDDSLKTFALELRNLCVLWSLEKFGPINQFDAASLSGYDAKTGMKRTSVVHETTDLDSDDTLQLKCDALPIDKILLEFKAKAESGEVTLPVYVDVRTAHLFSWDILSGRIAMLASRQAKKGIKDPVFESMGGTAKDEKKIVSRVLRVYAGDTPETKNTWILRAMSGPGHLSSTGLIVPNYKEETAATLLNVRITSETLKEFALAVNDMAMLWMLKKYGPVVKPGLDKKRKEIEAEIAKRRKA